MNAATRLRATAVKAALTDKELRERNTDDSDFIIVEAHNAERILEGAIMTASDRILSKLRLRTIPRGMGSGPTLYSPEMVRALENQLVVCNFGSALDGILTGAVTLSKNKVGVDVLDPMVAAELARGFMDDYTTKDFTVTTDGTWVILTSKVS